MAASEAVAHEGVQARLPRMEPEEARRRNAVLAALGGRASALGPLKAEIEADAPALPALRFLNGAAAQPVTVAGAPALWVEAAAASGLPEALVELSRLEPLLAAAEAALGLSLDPDHMQSQPERRALGVRLSATADGEAWALRLWLPPALPLHPQPRPFRIEVLGVARAVTVRLRLSLEGPRAPLAELRKLAHGDLVLVPGNGSLRAALTGGPGPAMAGVFDAGSHRFTFEERMDERTDEGDAEADGQVRVRLRLELGEVEATLGELTALAPGGVLKVALSGDAPQVQVVAGGARIATGRLVSLGDAYGVLVEQVAAPAEVASA